MADSTAPRRPSTRRSRARHRPAASNTVPGPTDNPATNMLLADLLLRMSSMVMRRMIERSLLKRRYGTGTAGAIVRGRSVTQTLTRAALARIGTGSLPGAVLVGGGLAVKLLLDRGRARRLARAEGDSVLLDQARREGRGDVEP